MSNSGRKKSKETYTIPSAAQWRASFDANQAAQERAYSTPYNNGTVSSDVTSIYNLPQTSTYKQDYLPNSTSEDNESKGFFASVWDDAKHFVNNINMGVADAVKPFLDGSAVRMMFQNVFNTRVTQYEEELRKTNTDLKDVDAAQKYTDLVYQYKWALDDYHKTKSEEDLEKVKTLQKQLDDFENVVKRSSKSSDALLDLFVDDKKEHKLQDDVTMHLNSIFSEKATKKDASQTSQILEMFPAALKEVQLSIESVLDGFNSKERIKQAIRNTPDEQSNISDKYFKSYKDVNPKDLEIYADSIRAAINEKKDYLNRYARMRQSDIADNISTAKNGNWLFDPKKIDPNFKKKYEDQNAGIFERIFNPKIWAYNVVNLGSSYSMFEQMAAQFAYQGAAKAASQMIAYAAGGELGTGAKIAIGAANAVGGIFLANKMRTGETESEVLDAYSNRLLQYAYKNKSNLSNLFDFADQKAKQIGVDPKELTDLDKIQLALAYNIDSGDKKFDKEKKDARQGLAKVFNDNMALSTGDYIETIPFLEFGGKIATKGLGKAVYNRVFKTGLELSGKASSEVAERYMAMNADKFATSITDRIINKALGEGEQNLVKKIRLSHIADFLKKKVKQSSLVGASEGIEEGQQQLLQNRYQRGEYDNYKGVQSNFDIGSVFSDVRLGLESVADYYGVNPYDPDNGSAELRKAMNTGFISGILNSQLMGSFSNLFGDRAAKYISINNDNTRALFNQIKNDNVLKQLVASNYAAAQDDAHVGIFFKALANGRSASRLSESFNKMKQFKGDLVDDKFIDDDISLLQTTDFMMHNNKFLDLVGIDKIQDTATHRDLIQSGVKAIQDYENLSQLHDKNIKELESSKQKIIQELLGDRSKMSDGVRNTYDSILDQYNKYLDNYISSNISDSKRSSLRKAAENQVRIIGEVKPNDHRYETAVLQQMTKFIGTTAFQSKAQEQAKSKAEESGEKAEDVQLDKIIELEDYVKNRADLLFSHAELQQKQALLNQLKAQHKLLQLIIENTGTDINVDKLGNTIRVLSNSIKDNKQQYKDMLKYVNDEIDKKNKLIDEYNKQNPDKPINKHKRVTIDNILSDYHQFSGISEIEKLFSINALNDSALKAMAPAYTAYKYGVADPNSSLGYAYNYNWSDLTKEEKDNFKSTIFDTLSDEDKDKYNNGQLDDDYFKKLYLKTQRQNAHKIDALRQEYNQIINKLGQEDLEQTPAERVAALDRIKEIQKETAKAIVEGRLEEKHNRKRIAHRQFLKDGGITNDDIDNLNTENEDPSVRSVVEEKQKQINEEHRVDDQDVTQEPTHPVVDNHYEEQTPTQSDDYTDENYNEDRPDKDESYEQKEPVMKDNDGIDAPQQEDKLEGASDAQRELHEQLYGKKEKSKNKQNTPTLKASHSKDFGKISKFLQDILDEYTTDKQIREIPGGTVIARVIDPETFDVIDFVIINKDGYIKITRIKDGEDIGNNTTTGFNIPEGYSVSDEDLEGVQGVRMNIINWDSDTHAEFDGFDKDGNRISGNIDTNAVVSKTVDIDTPVASPLSVDKEDTNQGQQEDQPQDDQSQDDQKDNPTESYDDKDGQLNDNGDNDLDVNSGNRSAKSAEDQFGKDLIIEDHDDGSLNNDRLDSSELQLGEEHKQSIPDPRLVGDHDDVYRRLLESTFFYQPDSKDTIRLTVNGKDLKFKYPVKPNSELAQKLVQRGWFGSVRKYYVVSGKNSKDTNSFTVSLVIEDDKSKSTYITTIKTPSSYSYIDKFGMERSVDGIQKLINQLKFIGVDKDRYPSALIEAREEAYSRHVDAKPVPSNFKYEEQYQYALKRWYNDARKWYETLSYEGEEGKIKRGIEYNARRKAATGRILTDSQVWEQIENLINSRNAIIEAYCDKNEDGVYSIPDQIKTNVVPEESRISNGSITKDGKLHSISKEGNEFGIPTDIKEIDRQIKEGELLFGFGRGRFADDPYTISSINGPDTQYNGIGYSGTIYLMHQGPCMSEVLVPITLSEQRFDRDGDGNVVTPENVQLSFDPTTGKLNGNSKPSVAEVLLYMITGKLSTEYLPSSSIDTIKAFADFIINNGESTTKIGTKKSSLNRQKFLADKQIAVVDNHGVACLQIVNTDSNGSKSAEYIPIASLFGTNSDDVRKHVVSYIAKNMHWNTDVDAMSHEFPHEIINVIRKYFQNNKGKSSFSICGVKELTFDRDDLFDNDNGTLKYNHTNVLSWMVKAGKLLATTNEQNVFKAPFVYATGVRTEEAKQAVSDARSQVKPTKADKKAGTVTINSNTTTEHQEADRFGSKSIERIKSKLGFKADQMDSWLVRGQKESQEKLAAFSGENAKERGGLTDIIMLDIDKSDFKLRGDSGSEKLNNFIEDFKQAVKDKLQKYAEVYEKENGVKFDVDKLEINENVLKNTARSLFNGTAVPHVSIFKNGSSQLYFVSTSSLLGRNNTITGVFSREKQKGTVDMQKAREWIADRLGIKPDHVVVIDGVMKSSQDEDVFGLMDVVTDVLNQGDSPIFMFSDKAGRGIQYHEAWHYVNLLLHNKHQRQQIYYAYVKAHPELKNKSYKQIEELLAEDFREYAELQNRKGVIGFVKRAFDNIKRFSGLFRNKYAMYDVFRNINNGKYRLQQIDRESLQQFKMAYKNGVNSKSFYVSNIAPERLNKLQGIDTRQQFFQAATSLANKLIDDYSLDSTKGIDDIKYDDIQQFLTNLKSQNPDVDPSIQRIIDSIAKNPDVFVSIVSNILKQYSIDLKEDAFKIKQSQVQESETQEAQDTGDKSGNTYDKDPLSISKKDNVATRAKLFLGQIKKMHAEIDPFTGEKTFVYDKDPIFGNAVYVPFDQAWNTILNSLWDTDSYAKIGKDNKYDKHSIRGVIQRLAEASPFFEALDKKLDLIKDDLELQSQIHSTIRSQMAQMMQTWISDPKKKSSNNSMSLGYDQLSEYESSKSKGVSVVKREWELVNDNQLKAIKSIPRIWSQNLYQAGLINSEQMPIISKEFTDGLRQRKMRALQYTSKHKFYPKTKEDIGPAYSELSDILVDLFKYLSIPIDNEVLETYVNNEVGENKLTDKAARYKVLQSLVKSDKIGSISKIMQNIISSTGKSKIKSGRIEMDLDRVFSGYKNDSQIAQLARAYNECYPSPQQFSVTAPDGTQRYPISENNTMSDIIRILNHDTDQTIESLQRSEYCKHSLLLDIASQSDHETSSRAGQFKLNYFVGLRDIDNSIGRDYHGVTQLEDYIAKMLMTSKDMLVLPTMADKKTWYAISQQGLRMPHNVVSYDNFQLDQYTMDILTGYFRDELNSVKQYYSKENIEYLIKHPESLRKNFHGELKNGRISWGGNGGRFRYFSDIFVDQSLDEDYQGSPKDLNSILQYEYLREQEDMKTEDGIFNIRKLRDDDNDIDGFEYIRQRLDKFEEWLNGDDLNKLLQQKVKSMVYAELMAVSKDGNLKLGNIDENGQFVPTKIPQILLRQYAELFKQQGLPVNTNNVYMNDNINDLALSLMTNHVLSSIISTIEMEKVFSGDPAFYKNKFKTKQMKFDGKFYDIDVVNEKHSDKIKRLGALLSPGQKVKTDYSEEQLEKYPELQNRKYTVLNVSDIKTKSEYLKEIKNIFTRQYMIDDIESSTDQEFTKKLIEKNGFDNVEDFVKAIYQDEKLFKKVLSSYPKNLRDSFVNQADSNTSTYGDITVSDAQVIIRPALYRKIRIGLGTWSFGDEFSDYSDEMAYNILENDPDWQSDPKKAKIVSKLELYPLKMSYFQNASQQLGDGFINLPIYNKMAIFPAFKYMLQSDNGKAIYERMNKKGNEIDMLAFDSAIKVGANQQQYTPYKKGISSLDNMDTKSLKQKSDKSILPSDDIFNPGGKLQIQVQDLDDLRMQLNTEAHEALERAFGTQALKLLLSNINDELDYGIGKDSSPIKGKELRSQIINLINALTQKGVQNVINEFGITVNNGDIRANNKAVQKILERVVKTNGVGENTIELFRNGGLAEALGSRLLFEQSISKVVNKRVVDVNLNGGSAVQQSVFGLVGKKKVDDEEGGLHVLNGGRKLKWIRKDNSMEIMLSVRLFRDIIPKEEQTTYKNMRQWLIDNDIIHGIKSDRVRSLTEEQIKFNDNLDEQFTSGILTTKANIDLENNHINSIWDAITNQDKLKEDTKKEVEEYLISAGYKDGLNTKKYEQVSHAGEQSNPKPIGIGYRIPTQGMSSIFAFTVADILPDNNGDNIIVPEEFTKQTGSDFDVDKIFVAMKGYRNGSEVNVDDTSQDGFDMAGKYDAKEIRNSLIQKYIDVLTDSRTFVDARGSIDTVTEKITGELLPKLRKKQDRRSMYELLPSFQSQTKAEFMTGKDGIGPYALATTNLAFTQTAHLTIDFGHLGEIYDLGALDQIKGKDGMYISAWLSAMVNAHVDVAKDPYISLININPATYSISELLLRAGKGIQTFSFLAQPALVKYANLVNAHNGIYLEQSEKDMSIQKYQQAKLLELKNEYRDKLKESLSQVDADKSLSKDQKDDIKNKILVLLSNDTRDVAKAIEDSKIVFDYDEGIYSIQNPDSYRSHMMQLYSILAFQNLTKFADAIEQLVQCSQVDTKKFGNSITDHWNFYNKYEQFKYLHKDPDSKDAIIWKINDEAHSNLENEDALEYYFDKLWISDKLSKATQLTRGILKDQLFTATDEYNVLYHSIMYSLLGDPFGFKGEANEYNFYRSTSDKKFIQAISSSINAIARHNMLMNSKILTNSDDRNYTGYIDFTMNGDKDAVFNKVMQLVYGNPQSEDKYYHKSIFQNYANFIYRLQNGLLGSEFNDLLDDTGNINNEFLNYYISKIDNKFQIGRFTTKMSYINVDPNQRLVLQSALHQLLTHSNSYVRRLFRDIVLYDYYSTYNNDSFSSIFDLVPIGFKMQYVQSITDSMKSEDLIGRISENSGKINPDEYIDTICRNYWYNDKIVPVYSLTQQAFAQTKLGAEKYLLPNYVNGNRIPGAIITSKGGNHPYFKIHVGNKYYLYKKIGSVMKGKSIYRDIYVISPKLGIHQGGNHQYEFYTGSLNESIFDDNLLPETFNYSNVEANVINYINQLSPIGKGDNAVKLKYKEHNAAFTGFSNANYYQVSEQQKNSYNLTQNAKGDVRIIYSNNPQKYAESRNNLKININNEQKTGVNIDSKQDATKVVDDIVSSLGNFDKDNENLNIYISGRLGDFNITDADRSEYIDNQLSYMVERYKLEYPDATVDDINEAQQQFLTDIQSKVDDSIKQLKNNQFVDRIIKDLLVRGYSISSISTDDFDGIGEAAVRSAQLNQEDFATAQPAYIIYDRSKYTQDNMSSISESIAKFDDEDFLTSEQDDDLLTELKNVNDGKDEAIDDARKDMVKDENDVSDILGGLKQVDDNSFDSLDSSTSDSTKDSNNNSSNNHSYGDSIKPNSGYVFVFGSNPEGRHGAGAAKIAATQFGAKRGVGEGLVGDSYALPTKDLRIKKNRGLRSISSKDITNNIRKMYEVAKQNPNKKFAVAYTNTERASLNGYTGIEMANMFKEAGPIPNNVYFSNAWINDGLIKNSDYEQAENISEDAVSTEGLLFDNNNDIDNLLGGMKQFEDNIIQHDDSKFEKDAMDGCKV